MVANVTLLILVQRNSVSLYAHPNCVRYLSIDGQTMPLAELPSWCR